MTICPACAAGCADDSRFCARCGASLAAPRATATERRVVTTLFCDLVDFTSLCENCDPEDVDAYLREYYARACRIIGLYGGSVEKYVGDAVVGIFGVPIVHEDDAERAVRAAARLVEETPALASPDGRGRQVRIGVDSGVAVVRLDVAPGSGQGILTGDAVVTAARLQTVAPPGGVVVSDLTHSMTADVALFEALPAVRLKGKSGLVRSWLITGGLAKPGADLRRSFATPLIGREVEIGILAGMFEKAAASSNYHAAIIVGDAGIGKTRLVAELARRLDEAPGTLVQWRQSRCPAFGEGTTVWPLAQIVRQHAGILDEDDDETAERKLQRVLRDERDAEWLAERLRPLIDLPARPATHDENFAAWLRFLESMCRARPTIIVIEDVHWASELLVAFLAHVAAHLRDVPLLSIGTARPEILTQHPDYPTARAVDAQVGRLVRLDLHPLSPAESERLVAGLTRSADVGDAQESIVERSGGNPLYAEELVRLLREHDEDAPPSDRALDEAVRRELPASLHTLISARLDSLGPLLRDLLLDAAVIGEVFWPAALAAVSGHELALVEAAIAELTARELVRRVPESSAPVGEQLTFWHSVTRDVAYARLTRERRAARHAAVATWLAGIGEPRSYEMSERLAYHLATALELAHTLRDGQLERELHGPAVEALLRAGDEARALDVHAAERHLSRALAIAGRESPCRPQLLSLHGLALMDCGRFEEAERTLDAAASALSAAGERRRAAAALSARAHALSVLGEIQAIAVDAEAVALLEGDDPSAELIQVLENAGRNLYAAKGDAVGAAGVLERAIASARSLDLPEPPLALAYLGHARCALGDPLGLNDCRRAREGAATLELGADAGLVRLNCTDLLRAMRGPREASGEYIEVAETAKQRGWGYVELAARANVVECAVMMGEWEDALAVAADLARETERAQDVWDLLFLRCQEVVVSSSRGDSTCGPDLLRWVIETGRSNPISWVSAYAMLASAAASLRLGNPSQAAGLLEEWLCGPQAPNSSAFSWLVPEAARTALEVGDTCLARRLAETLHGALPLDLLVSLTLSALLDEAAGRHDAAVADFASAAQDWHEFAMPYEEAHALAGRGRCLLALGRAAAAAAALEEAIAIFVRLRAEPGLAQTKETLRRCPA